MRGLYFSSVALALVACGGGGGGGGPIESAPPPWLDEKVEAQARTADPQGQRVGDFLRGTVYGKAMPVEWMIHLDAGQCYWFSGVGSEGVDRLSIYLWDPGSHRVNSERNPAASVLMKYCAEQSGPFKIQGKAAKGKGYVSFGIYASAEKAPVPVVPVVASKVDLGPLIDQQAASAAPGATRAGEFFTGAGDQSEWTIAMQAGTCYWLIGVGEPKKVSKLQVYLWDPRQKRITESHNENNVAVAGHCATAPGMYKFQAKVQSGSGEYKVGVYSKPQ